MKKSLSASNSYLKDHALKKEMVKRFVESSSAIEGIHIKRRKKSASSKKKKIKRGKA
jgi:hypothetical protein